MTPHSARPWLGAMAIDAAAVLVFAAAGREEHDGATSVAGILGVAAPFLIGALAGWLATPGARTRPLAWRTAAGVWVGALVVGMLLRRLAWDRGTAAAFVLVATIVLGAQFGGWRALFVVADRRRPIRSSGPPLEAGHYPEEL